MQTLIDFDGAVVFTIPMLDSSGRHTVREGMLLEGPQGWGEFSPSPDADAVVLARWLTAAIEAGTVGYPDALRGRVPVAVPIPAVDPETAHRLASSAGCAAADVSVGGPGSLADDVARVEAVRDALGSAGEIRCDANGQWNIDEAVTAISGLDRAADGLTFVEQPCTALEDVAAVRRRVDVRIAVDQSLRGAQDPRAVPVAGAADVAVLSPGPLGGVRRALRLAETCGLPCVVSSTGETSIGLTGGLALAGVLPELPFASSLGTRVLLADDVVAEARSLFPVDGNLPVAPMPPAPDPDLLRKHVITDPARVAWWRDRLRVAQQS